MIRYLMGELSPEDMSRIETEFFADDRCFERLAALESELVDSYVRGMLSEEDRERLEKAFLASPARRSKVEFARALLAAAGAGPPREAEESWQVRVWRSLGALFQGLQPALRVATGLAAVVLVLGAAWLVVETARLRNQLGVVQAQRRDAEDRLAQQRARLEQLTQQLRREREQRAAGPSRLPEVAVSLILTPGLVRGLEEPARLAISAQVQRLRLELDLPEQAAYRSYRATIRTAEGGQVWSEDPLRARTRDSGKAVVLSFPAAVLTPGEYLVELRGLTESGAFEALESYYFRLSRP